jgi:hypothetical protein
VILSKANLAFGRCRGRLHELLDGGNDSADRFVVIAKSPFEFRDLMGQFLVRRQKLSQLDERPHDEDASLNRPRRVKDTGGHNGAVLGEGIWDRPRKANSLQARIAFGENRLFGSLELKQKVARKAFSISFDGAVQRPCGYSVQGSQVAVEDYSLSPNCHDEGPDSFDRNESSIRHRSCSEKLALLRDITICDLLIPSATLAECQNR